MALDVAMDQEPSHQPSHLAPSGPRRGTSTRWRRLPVDAVLCSAAASQIPGGASDKLEPDPTGAVPSRHGGEGAGATAGRSRPCGKSLNNFA